MTGQVFTAPDRKLAVEILRNHGFTPVRIAAALLMNIEKVRAILKELAEDELARDQMAALAGPFVPLSRPDSKPIQVSAIKAMHMVLERLTLQVLEGQSDDEICTNLSGLQQQLDLPKDLIRALVAGLRSQGLAAYHSGLLTDEGEPAGSGYRITHKGSCLMHMQNAADVFAIAKLEGVL